MKAALIYLGMLLIWFVTVVGWIVLRFLVNILYFIGGK